MAHLKLQGSTFHARLTIPRDVRSKLNNKAEFWGSTGTGDIRLAEIIGAEMVAGWKRQIYSARNGVSIAEWTKTWAKELREARTTPHDEGYPSDRLVAEFAMADELEDMVQARRITLPAAKATFEVAMGYRAILADHAPDYLRQYKNHNIKTQAAYRAAVDRFVNQFPDDQQVTTKSIKQWVAKMADEENLAAKTIQRMIGQAQTFWSYLVEHEIVKRDANPFTTFKLSVPKTAMRSIPILPFRPEEIVEILRAAIGQKDKQLTLLITLGMYTGARIEELAMLKKADINLGEGLLQIRGTKTEAAYRELPIHTALIPFLSKLDSDSKDVYVIEGLTIDGRGERGKAIGKRFGRLKAAMGYKGRDKVFHSIRKTVATLLEQAEVSEGVAADILGHEKQTMTYGLYSGGSSFKQKCVAVQKIRYPEV